MRSIWSLVAVFAVLISVVASAAPSRRELVAQALSQSVRVMVYDGDSARRTASGVVIATEIRAGEPTTYVITNAHVADTHDYGKPRYGVVTGVGSLAVERRATVIALGKAPDNDLAVLEVPGVRWPVAQLAADDDLQVGDDVMVVAAPYGKALSVSGGLVSQVEIDLKTRVPTQLKTDASIGYGASGGGLYARETGKLLAIIEGYRTAKINFAVGDQPYSFDVPMPGETFCAPSGKVRKFLAEHKLSHLVAAVVDRAIATTP